MEIFFLINKSDLSNASGGVLVWPIHFAPDHIFLSHSLVVDYVLFSILMQSSCCCLTTLNTTTALEMLTELVNQSPPMLRMLPQQHGHLHPIDLRLVSSTRDPNNGASSTRVQVPEEISTLVPTNQPTRRGPKLTLIRLAIAAIGKHPTKVFQIWTKEIFDTLSRLWKT